VGCLADQGDQFLQRVGAVALLGAVALGLDDNDTVLGQPVSGQFLKAYRDIGRDVGREARVKAQLDGGRQLVDVLAAGAGGANEGLVQFRLRRC
jgi:hypothetical protein